MEGELMNCLLREIDFGMRSFPDNRMVFKALIEEVGELAKAMLEGGDNSEVFKESIQVAAVAIRIAQQGDAEIDYKYDRSMCSFNEGSRECATQNFYKGKPLGRSLPGSKNESD